MLFPGAIFQMCSPNCGAENKSTKKTNVVFRVRLINKRCSWLSGGVLELGISSPALTVLQKIHEHTLLLNHTWCHIQAAKLYDQIALKVVCFCLSCHKEKKEHKKFTRKRNERKNKRRFKKEKKDISGWWSKQMRKKDQMIL